MMVERFYCDVVLPTGRDDGGFVRFSDYETLESRCRELEAERDRANELLTWQVYQEYQRAEKAEAEVARLQGLLRWEGYSEEDIASADASPAQSREEVLEEAARIVDNEGLAYAGLREGVIIARIAAAIRAKGGENG